MGSLAEGLKVNEFFQRLRAEGAGAGSVARVFDAKQGARLATLISSNLLAENLAKIRTEAKGASAAMAKILMRGAPGEYKKMTSAYEGMMLAIAKSGVMSAAAKFMNKMAAAFKYLSQTSPALLKVGHVRCAGAGRHRSAGLWHWRAGFRLWSAVRRVGAGGHRVQVFRWRDGCSRPRLVSLVLAGE